MAPFNANVVICDLDLNFQGNKFESLTSWKWEELLQKCIIWHLLTLTFAIDGIIENVLAYDLDLNLQGNNLKGYYYLVNCES